MTDDELYDRFIVALRRMWRAWTVPCLSIAEMLMFLAILTFDPPWWIAAPVMLAWLIWRNDRDS